MRALVTGATGFIGRHVAEALAERGHEVRCVVRRPEKAAGLAACGLEVVPGDLGEPESLRAAAHGRDVIVHAAAQVGEWGPRAAFDDANVAGTRHLLDAAEAMGVGRLVHVSSVAVYGRRRGRIDEGMPCQRTGDRYVDTKVGAEDLVWQRHRAGALACAAVRPCVVYGPYDWKFVPRVAAGLQAGRIPLVGGGGLRAPVVSVRDVADLVIECATHAAAAGEAFNCASTEAVTWKQVFEQVAELVGARAPRFSIPYPVAYAAGAVLEAAYRLAGSRTPPDITRFAAQVVGVPVEYDMTKAARLLSWRPGVAFADGLAEAVAWLRSAGGA
jgi:nucleoside-diphosphate-sugar epimerase